MHLEISTAQIIQWIIQGLFAVLASIGLFLFKQFKGEMAMLRTSTEKLNTQVAVVIERSSWHGKEIEKHERRLSKLETPRSRSK